MMNCQTHNFLFGWGTEEGMMGAMDLRNDLLYLIDQEFILKNGDKEATDAFFNLFSIEKGEIDLTKTLPKKLPTAIGPDIQLGVYIACDKCGERLKLSEKEKIIAKSLYRSYVGGDSEVSGLVPSENFKF